MTLLIALEFNHTPVAALAGLVLCLGVTYWLMLEGEDRGRRAPGKLPPGYRHES